MGARIPLALLPPLPNADGHRWSLVPLMLPQRMAWVWPARPRLIAWRHGRRSSHELVARAAALISISAAAGGASERGMRDGQWGPRETQDGGELPGMPHFLLGDVPGARGPGGVRRAAAANHAASRARCSSRGCAGGSEPSGGDDALQAAVAPSSVPTPHAQ